MATKVQNQWNWLHITGSNSPLSTPGTQSDSVEDPIHTSLFMKGDFIGQLTNGTRYY